MFVRNQIGFIKDSNWKTQNEEEIADYLSSKFNKLFTSSYPTFSPDLDNLFVLCIIEEENLGLSMNPDEEEIKICVWELHPLKSPVWLFKNFL